MNLFLQKNEKSIWLEGQSIFSIYEQYFCNTNAVSNVIFVIFKVFKFSVGLFRNIFSMKFIDFRSSFSVMSMVSIILEIKEKSVTPMTASVSLHLDKEIFLRESFVEINNLFRNLKSVSYSFLLRSIS